MRVLVVDDLPDARELLADLAQRAFPGARVKPVEGVSTATAALEQPFDLALVDLSLADGDGADLIASLKGRQPGCLAVVCSIHDDERRLFRAMQAGADGYLLKDQPREATARQLRSIADGQPPLSPPIARRLIQHFQASVPPEPAGTLSPRETEVLARLAAGLTLAEIGAALGLSRHTVGDHVKNIYRKLNVSSRAQAALQARRLGLT